MKKLKYVLIFVLLLISIHTVSYAGTKYNGIDYSRVYDFDYYIKHNSYPRTHYSNSPDKALKYFVKYGMAKRQRACESFDVNSYINGNADLRRLYKNDYVKYYTHYRTKGYKQSKRKGTYTGISKMKDYLTVWNGVNYASVYDYNYYTKKYDKLDKYGVDDQRVLKYFVLYGMKKGDRANKNFNVKAYAKQFNNIYGTNYKKYFDMYLNGVTNIEEDPEEDVIEEIEEEPEDIYTGKAVNGKRTLLNYLAMSLVPCGKTLYIWGGGWEDDASQIGYQSSWNSFFDEHATSGYDYTNYRYKYWNGLDCSGFVGWVIYNTLYTKSGGPFLVYQSTTVASNYKKKGWCKLTNDDNFKPGDVVSMNGHVWISLGQCSDRSVVVMHSSPKGVQISGTSGRAAKLANYYMSKYFRSWPYEARTVGSGYLNYEGKARWNVSGGVLSDPDGIQNMTADQVLKILLGK